MDSQVNMYVIIYVINVVFVLLIIYPLLKHYKIEIVYKTIVIKLNKS